jgi:hypothetical protein
VVRAGLAVAALIRVGERAERAGAPRGLRRRPSVPAYDHYGADRLTPGPGPGLRSAGGCRYGTIMSGTGE